MICQGGMISKECARVALLHSVEECLFQWKRMWVAAATNRPGMQRFASFDFSFYASHILLRQRIYEAMKFGVRLVDTWAIVLIVNSTSALRMM